MKKYYCITLLAFIVVILLQGYNISPPLSEQQGNRSNISRLSLHSQEPTSYNCRPVPKVLCPAKR